MQQQNRDTTTAIYIIGALCLLLILAYLPVLGSGFVNYDDPFYVTANEQVKGGLSLDGIRWAFTTFHFYNWHPLTWLSHMLDVQLFGLNPLGHHLTNLLLHLANTLLLFVLLKRATGFATRSACVALLFALHPLHVESVAWVAERKDVLSTLFGLLSMLAYVRYARAPKAASYALCLLLFAVGLLAKAMLVTLPLMLLIMDVWPLGRLRGTAAEPGPSVFPDAPLSRLVLEKFPLALLSLVSIVVTFLAQKQGGALAVEGSALDNAGNAFANYVGYLLKTLLPLKLAIFYPYDPPSLWPAALALAIVGAVSAAALWYARRFPWLAFGWFWYVITLLPVIGFIRIGQHAMADRYTYVPLIGLFIMAVWGCAELAQRRLIPGAAPAAVLVVISALCATLSYRQARTWHDSVSLFSHALSVTEGNWLAHRNLANALANRGDLATALQHTTESLRLHPEAAEYVSQAWLLLKLGQPSEAAQACRSALSLDPGNTKARFILGLASIALQDNLTVRTQYEFLQEAGSPYAQRLLQQMDAGRAVPAR